LRRFKVPEEKIAALQERILNPALFGERELVALELADSMTESGKAVGDGLWQRLNEHYDHGQIIELACSIGLFNYFNRLSEGLRVDITK
jgi:alkylhydroperoxidase family enzyme